MIVSCPHCTTNFKVPEGALGNKGRTLKCARCAHVWREAPPVAEAPVFDEVPLEAPPTASLRQSLPRDEVTERMLSDLDMAGDLALAEIDAAGFGGEGSERLPVEENDPFAEMSELMRARKPETMPDMFTLRPPKPAPRRRGGSILWVVVFLLFSAALATGLYYFQDRLIDHWPGLSKYYDKAGVREEVVGAGLSFRNYTTERLPQDNSEVLIVRGVIANGTEQRKELPMLRLALYNGPTLLQQKIFSPPQTALDARATVGFKVTLDQPDATATRFEVTFTTPQADEKKTDGK